MRYHNDDSFEGQWKAGKKDGYGTYTRADGTVEVGSYSDGKDAGDGVLWSADRQTAERLLDGIEQGAIALDEASELADQIVGRRWPPAQGVAKVGEWLADKIAGPRWPPSPPRDGA